MKHYPHHISDFNQATRHLNRFERSIYRDLIELYYDIEGQLTHDVEWICKKILANGESTAVETSLNEFFIKTPDGWYHERCEAEIEKYKNNTSQKALAGKASALKKAAKRQQALNGNPTAVETPLNGTPTNHEPRTINHKPIVGESAKRATRKCPADFLVTDSMTEWALLECPGVEIHAATRKFRDHTFKTAMTDWAATWRNWIRSDFERMPKRQYGSETAYQRSKREQMERDFPNLTHKGADHGAAIALG